MSTRDTLILSDRNAWHLELTTVRDLQLKQLAQLRHQDEPALSVFSPYAPGLHGEILDAPSLVIEDHSAIRLFEHSGDEAYSYRALLLAGDDDLVAIGVERCDGFETYTRDWLGLGSPTLLTPQTAGPEDSLATRCRLDSGFVKRVVAHAQAHQGINILPYMGTWPLWELAGCIAQESAAPTRVIAPPPQLTRRVNDKIWFTELAQAVCGQAAIPPAFHAENFTNLCRLSMELAKTHCSIAIKLPDSASSAGNLVLDSDQLRDTSWQSLHDQLYQRLCKLGWNGSFPLQVVAWERAVTASPSAQLWIPAIAEGGPCIEAIFEQHSSGLSREFDGARPSQLGDEWQARIALQAFEIGRVLQYLGYFGRCSLDAIVVDSDDEPAQLHWVECNGRWGGVSLPLSLNRRLDQLLNASTAFVILEEAHQQLAPREMEAVLQTLNTLLFRKGMREYGAVLLSPGRLLDGSGYEIMVRDSDIESAMRTGTEVARLLGSNSAMTAASDLN